MLAAQQQTERLLTEALDEKPLRTGAHLWPVLYKRAACSQTSAQPGLCSHRALVEHRPQVRASSQGAFHQGPPSQSLGLLLCCKHLSRML